MSAAAVTFAFAGAWLVAAALAAVVVGRVIAQREHQVWLCGAFEDPDGYRCALPAGHELDEHQAWVDGVQVGAWPRRVDAL